MCGVGCGVWDVKCWAWGLGVGVCGLGFEDWVFGVGDQASGRRVQENV